MRAAAIAAVLLASCGGPAAPSPAEVIAKSHAILDSFDHADMPVIRRTLGEAFVRFEGEPIDRTKELAELPKRIASGPGIATRTWSNERAFVGKNTAVFIGEAREQNAGNKLHGGGYIYDGWYTLTWAPEGDAWKLVSLTWKVAGTEDEGAFWNQIFHNAIGFEHQPNRLLTATVAGVTPGEALDVAMGQGRNALYLARYGWKVTGVDISDEGLRQAREVATRDKLPLQTIEADVAKFDFGSERWDLVTLIYAPSAHSRISDIQRSIRRGGLFVYEYFTSYDPDDPTLSPAELAKRFGDGWEIVRNDVVMDVPDWARDHAELQRFVARKK